MPQDNRSAMRYTVDRLLDVLATVESDNNAKAVGDRGKAVGMYQIWKDTVTEANRVIGRKDNPIWTDRDRKNPRLSRAMAKAVLEFHYRRGTTDPVKLGGKWRDPYGRVAKRERLEGKTDQKDYEENIRRVLAGGKPR